MDNQTMKQGKDTIVALRLFEDIESEDAMLLMFETENSDEKTRSFDTIKTKSGNAINLGEIEYSPSTTSYVPVGSKQIEKYEKAFDEGKVIELWRINKLEEGESENKGKYKAKYKRGYIVKWDEPANVEDAVELNMEFAIYGRERDGFATLTEDQINTLENQYEFEDTTKKTTGGGE